MRNPSSELAERATNGRRCLCPLLLFADQYFEFVQKKFANVEFPKHLKGHATHPFVWLETGAEQKIVPIGGRYELTCVAACSIGLV